MKQFVIEGAKTGKCPLCRGKAAKEKPVFVVWGPFNGPICGEHLHVLAQQNDRPGSGKTEGDRQEILQKHLGSQ